MKRWSLLYLLLLPVLQSCLLPEPSVIQPYPKESKNAEVRSLEVKSSKSREKIAKFLEREDYYGALQMLEREARSARSEASLAKEYALAINGLSNQGEGLLSRGDYAGAGLAFRRILDSYPHTENVRAALNLSSESVAARIEKSSRLLMDEGLLAYRSGKLKEAVESWEKILLFDPRNRAALQAVETARRQMENLRTVQ